MVFALLDREVSAGTDLATAILAAVDADPLGPSATATSSLSHPRSSAKPRVASSRRHGVSS